MFTVFFHLGRGVDEEDCEEEGRKAELLNAQGFHGSSLKNGISPGSF